MKCPRCENQNPVGTIICSQCGTYLKKKVLPLHGSQAPTTSVIQADQALQDIQAQHMFSPPPGRDVEQERSSSVEKLSNSVPPEILLHKLPVGPIKTLFERGGVLDQKFALKRELGRGGMGFVFAGEDLSLGREVAIKILPPHYNDDENVVHRFHREARAMASLDHPNIVTVYSIGNGDGLHYFVMKKLQGETLAHELKRQELALKPRLSPPQVVKLICQVCGGLAHAHAKGILHRDIKPGNLMLSDQGVVSIMDFGIVKLLNTAETMMQTAHGKIFGTPEYMSPEQAMGKGNYSPASDLYALAVVAYELLCGEIPFKGETPIEIILQHIRAKVPDLVGNLPNLYPQLGPVLQRAMAKNPADRYASALELSVALQEAIQISSEQIQNTTPPVSPVVAVVPNRIQVDHIKSDFEIETLHFEEPDSIELAASTDELSDLIDVDDFDEDDFDQMEGSLQIAVEHERMTRGYEDAERLIHTPKELILANDPVLGQAPFTQELSSVQTRHDPQVNQERVQAPKINPVALKIPPKRLVPIQPVSTQPVSTQPVSTQPVASSHLSTQATPPPLPQNLSPLPTTTLDEPSVDQEHDESGVRAERVHVEVASTRKGHYRELPIRRKST